MRIKRIIFSVALLVSVTLLLPSCAQKYTYDNVSDEVKKEIDFILSNANIWENSKTDTVNFSFRNLVSEFEVSYIDSMYSDSDWIGIDTVYIYDVSRGTFSKESEKSIRYHMGQMTENGLAAGKHSKSWDHGWTIERKRDYLAEKIMYYKK